MLILKMTIATQAQHLSNYNRREIDWILTSGLETSVTNQKLHRISVARRQLAPRHKLRCAVSYGALIEISSIQPEK